MVDLPSNIPTSITITAEELNAGPIKALWNSFVADLKERFGNFETVHGAFLAPTGAIGIWVTWTHLQYVLQAAGTLLFGSAMLYGAYKFFHNPIKKLHAEEVLLHYLNKRKTVNKMRKARKQKAKLQAKAAATNQPVAAPIVQTTVVSTPAPQPTSAPSAIEETGSATHTAVQPTTT